MCVICGLFFPLHLGHDPINDGEGTDAGPGAVGQGDNEMCIRDSGYTWLAVVAWPPSEVAP